MSQKARSSRCPPPPVQGINHHQKKPCCREAIFWDRLSDLEKSTTFDHFPIPPKKEPVRVAEEYLIKLGSWTLMHICLVWENRTFSNCVWFGAAAVSFVRIATASLNWSSLNLAPAPCKLLKFDLHWAQSHVKSVYFKHTKYHQTCCYISQKKQPLKAATIEKQHKHLFKSPLLNI